jgi:hypothetical protein
MTDITTADTKPVEGNTKPCKLCQSNEHTTNGHFDGGSPAPVAAEGHFDGGSTPVTTEGHFDGGSAPK